MPLPVRQTTWSIQVKSINPQSGNVGMSTSQLFDVSKTLTMSELWLTSILRCIGRASVTK